MIRIARADDAAVIHAIYAPSVIDSAITFETELPGVDVMRQRILTRLQHYPWLVWEQDGDVLAYAYATRFRERAAYDWIAETSIYVHADARRQGIARRLYGVLLDVMRLQGINQAVGVITMPRRHQRCPARVDAFHACGRVASRRLQTRPLVGCWPVAKILANTNRASRAGAGIRHTA